MKRVVKPFLLVVLFALLIIWVVREKAHSETEKHLLEEIRHLSFSSDATEKIKDGLPLIRIHNANATPEEAKEWLEKNGHEELEALRNKKDAEISRLEDRIENLGKQIKSLRRTRAIAIPPLIAALDHPSLRVQNVAARSLERLTGKKYGTNQDKWNQWWLQNRLMWLGLEER